ncbi:MAG TPA: hypothetical protein VGI96_32235 [Streptosporangiaceae bacterium]|jgi:hypothetical protein
MIMISSIVQLDWRSHDPVAMVPSPAAPEGRRRLPRRRFQYPEPFVAQARLFLDNEV